MRGCIFFFAPSNTLSNLMALPFSLELRQQQWLISSAPAYIERTSKSMEMTLEPFHVREKELLREGNVQNPHKLHGYFFPF